MADDLSQLQEVVPLNPPVHHAHLVTPDGRLSKLSGNLRRTRLSNRKLLRVNTFVYV
jgi:hypothetical protein